MVHTSEEVSERVAVEIGGEGAEINGDGDARVSAPGAGDDAWRAVGDEAEVTRNEEPVERPDCAVEVGVGIDAISGIAEHRPIDGGKEGVIGAIHQCVGGQIAGEREIKRVSAGLGRSRPAQTEEHDAGGFEGVECGGFAGEQADAVGTDAKHGGGGGIKTTRASDAGAEDEATAVGGG